MTTRLEADVLIVGAGPVGLTLAMDLAWRGIDVLIAEERRAGEPPNVKCNHVAARTMEIFRRLGVAAKVREAGLPVDYPNDVAYRTSFLGTELTRIRIPCRADRYTATDGPDTWWPTPEPPHRINQIYLEPVLFNHAKENGVRIRNRLRAGNLSQSANGVVTEANDLDTGERLEIASRYLIGCDGARSDTRRQIGAVYEGDAELQRVQSTFIRAPSLLPSLLDKGGTPAWGSFAINPRRSGNVYAIDGRETWLVHSYFHEGERDFEAVDRDEGIRNILGVGPEFRYDIISKEDWIGRRLLANRFREDRVFLCGDSAHLWVPFAGYGMNAGIADAMNLSWQVAACLNGWADESILDCYEAERRPITDQVSRFAMNHAAGVAGQRKAVPAAIEAEGAEGDAVRAAIGKAAYELNVQQYCCAGLNFGYFYDASPIIAYDDEKPPSYTMANFTPSTVPGVRAPHLWLSDGRSLYDAMGADYTLLRFDPGANVSALADAASAAGMPLAVLDIDAASASQGPYAHRLVLVRPDQHIAWRGDDLPAVATILVNLVRSAGREAGGKSKAA